MASRIRVTSAMTRSIHRAGNAARLDNHPPAAAARSWLGTPASANLILVLVLRDRSACTQYPAHPLTLKYRLQNRAISSILGMDLAVKNSELPTWSAAA